MDIDLDIDMGRGEIDMDVYADTDMGMDDVYVCSWPCSGRILACAWVYVYVHVCVHVQACRYLSWLFLRTTFRT
jgi:hypothetical protein